MKKKIDFGCYTNGNRTTCRSTRPRIQRDVEGNPINQNHALMGENRFLDDELIDIIKYGDIQIPRFANSQEFAEGIIKRYNEYARQHPHLTLLRSVRDPEFTDNAVDTLRHDATVGGYDYALILNVLDDLEGHHDNSELYETLVRRIHEEISRVYPFLAEACEQKNDERGISTFMGLNSEKNVFNGDKYFSLAIRKDAKTGIIELCKIFYEDKSFWNTEQEKEGFVKEWSEKQIKLIIEEIYNANIFPKPLDEYSLGTRQGIERIIKLVPLILDNSYDHPRYKDLRKIFGVSQGYLRDVAEMIRPDAKTHLGLESSKQISDKDIKKIVEETLTFYKNKSFWTPKQEKWKGFKEKQVSKILEKISSSKYLKKPPRYWTKENKDFVKGIIKSIPLILDFNNQSLFLKDISKIVKIPIEQVSKIGHFLLNKTDYDRRFEVKGNRSTSKSEEWKRKVSKPWSATRRKHWEETQKYLITKDVMSEILSFIKKNFYNNKTFWSGDQKRARYIKNWSSKQAEMIKDAIYDNFSISKNKKNNNLLKRIICMVPHILDNSIDRLNSVEIKKRCGVSRSTINTYTPILLPEKADSRFSGRKTEEAVKIAFRKATAFYVLKRVSNGIKKISLNSLLSDYQNEESYAVVRNIPLNEVIEKEIRLSLAVSLDIFVPYFHNSERLPLELIAQKYNIGTHYVYDISTSSSNEFPDLYSHTLRFEADLRTDLGNYTHYCLKSLLTSFFKLKETKYYSEIPLFVNSPRVVDGFIFLEKQSIKRLFETSTLNMLKLSLDDLMHYKGISFDFTSNLSKSNLVKKCIKYQHKDILLMIVGTRNWFYQKNYISDFYGDGILYPENNKILNLAFFSELIRLNENTELSEKLFEIAKFNEQEDINMLKNLYRKLPKLKFGRDDFLYHLKAKDLIFSRNKNELNIEKKNLVHKEKDSAQKTLFDPFNY